MTNYSPQPTAVEPASEAESPTLDAALELLDRGRLITLCPPLRRNPIGENWTGRYVGKDWPNKRWTPDEVREAFEVRGNCNVGLLLGPQSKVIDIEIDGVGGDGVLTELFDGDMPIAPTYESRRGPHRLFRWDDRLATLPSWFNYPNDGGPVEVRLGSKKGAQSLLPPSITLDNDGELGNRSWQVGLDDCDPPPLPTSVIRKLLDTKKKARSTHRDTDTQAVLCTCVYSPTPLRPLSERLEEIYMKTLPSSKGNRNRLEFTLARHLKGEPELAHAEFKEVEQYFVQWHRIGAERGVIGSEEFVTLLQAERDWGTVKYAIGEGPLTESFARAMSKPFPKEAELYPNFLTLQKLVALCCELQECELRKMKGKKPFFLTCRDAGNLLGMTHKYANTLLHKLMEDKVIRCVTVGQRNRSSEYLYLAAL
jgi:hypothetical protein